MSDNCHKNISATFATLEADEYQTGLTAISACVDELDIFELDDVDLTFPVLAILDFIRPVCRMLKVKLPFNYDAFGIVLLL